jgi:hypothetical protein
VHIKRRQRYNTGEGHAKGPSRVHYDPSGTADWRVNEVMLAGTVRAQACSTHL